MSRNQKLKPPQITIDGKTYKVKKRLKLLRRMYELNDQEIEVESIEGLEVLYQFLVDCFNDEAVTMDAIEDNVDVDEFMDLFDAVAGFLRDSFTSKMESMPKKEPGTSH
ncbi:hypothetical protein FLK61_35130 [Paenalkalicoccus suaedae]|uniref:Phage tail assembly protein n=1 Tax=Paenalkalicoccus suaedae TaxID=2592382 RepID=A0A859FEX9_9BACI|nr:hypothetical protein [Paenalkalicoccus suaedae]QKS71903.1 hypothetical protein FLK61_35130 [Paenalkalicoccus suaedae]